ncbi:hypothetical protein Esti_001524 [Eimeria stiedai]
MIASDRGRGPLPQPYNQVGSSFTPVDRQQNGASFQLGTCEPVPVPNVAQSSGFTAGPSAIQQTSGEQEETNSEEGSWVCFWTSDGAPGSRFSLVGPQRFRSYLGIVKLACGPRQAAFIADDGRLYCWDWRHCGNMHACSPQLLEGRRLESMNVIDVSCGDGHLACITADGRVFTYGRGDKGQRGIGKTHENQGEDEGPDEILFPRKARQVACGAFFTLVLTDDGQVYSFGDGSHGVLGTDSVANRWTPAKVKFHDRKIAMIAAGTHHAIAVTDLGSTYTWGKNNLGQLGLGHNDDRLTPQVVSELCGQRTLYVAASDASVAATADGSLFLWGGGESNNPEPLERTDVSHLALGDVLYGLTRDNHLWVRPIGALEEAKSQGQVVFAAGITMLSAAGSMLMGVAPGSSFSETQQQTQVQQHEEVDEQLCAAAPEPGKNEAGESSHRKKRVSFSEVVESFAGQQKADQQAGRRASPADAGGSQSKSRTMSVPPVRKAKAVAAALQGGGPRTRSLSPVDPRAPSASVHGQQPCLRKTGAAERPRGKSAGGTSLKATGTEPRMKTTATETVSPPCMSRSTTEESMQNIAESELAGTAKRLISEDDEIFNQPKPLSKLTPPEDTSSPQHYAHSHHSTPEFGFTAGGVPVGGSPTNASAVESAPADTPWGQVYEANMQQKNNSNSIMAGNAHQRQQQQQHPHFPHQQISSSSAHMGPSCPQQQQQLQLQQQQQLQQLQVPHQSYYAPAQMQQAPPPQYQGESVLQQPAYPQAGPLYANMPKSNYPQSSLVPWESELDARSRMGIGLSVQTPGGDARARSDLAALAAVSLEMQREASRASLANSAASTAYEAQLQSLRLKELPLVLAGREAAIGGELLAQKEASELRKALSMARQDTAELEQEKQVLLRELRGLRLDVAEAKSSAAKKEQALDSLEEQVARQKKQIDRLKTELEDEAAQNHRDLKQMLEAHLYAFFLGLNLQKFNSAEARRQQMQQQLQEAHAYIHRWVHKSINETCCPSFVHAKTRKEEELCKQADAAINEWQSSYAKLQAEAEEAAASAKKKEEEAEAARAELLQQQKAFKNEKRMLVQKLDDSEEERLATQAERLSIQAVKQQNELYERACAEHTAELAALKRTEQRLRRELDEYKDRVLLKYDGILMLNPWGSKAFLAQFFPFVNCLHLNLIKSSRELLSLRFCWWFAFRDVLDLQKLKEAQSDLNLENENLKQALKLKEDIIKLQEDQVAEERSKANCSARLQGQLEDLTQELAICRENEKQVTARLQELQQTISAQEGKAADAEVMLERRCKDFEESQMLFKEEARKLRNQNSTLIAETNSLKSANDALEDKCQALQNAMGSFKEIAFEARLTTCDLAAHIIACAAAFTRRGFVELDATTAVDFQSLKNDFGDLNEEVADAAWTRVGQAIRALAAMQLPQVCEDVLHKLQSLATSLEAKVEKTQEELKEKCKELGSKEASLAKAQELQLQVEALEAEFTRKVEQMSKMEKEKAVAGSKTRDQMQALETQLSIARMTVAENKTEIAHLRERNSSLLMELSRQEERASELLAQNERLTLMKQNMYRSSTKLRPLGARETSAHAPPHTGAASSTRSSSLATLPTPKRTSSLVSASAAGAAKKETAAEAAARGATTPRRLALTPRSLGLGQPTRPYPK